MRFRVGNTSTDANTDLPVIYDATCPYAHDASRYSWSDTDLSDDELEHTGQSVVKEEHSDEDESAPYILSLARLRRSPGPLSMPTASINYRHVFIKEPFVSLILRGRRKRLL